MTDPYDAAPQHDPLGTGEDDRRLDAALEKARSAERWIAWAQGYAAGLVTAGIAYVLLR